MGFASSDRLEPMAASRDRIPVGLGGRPREGRTEDAHKQGRGGLPVAGREGGSNPRSYLPEARQLLRARK